MTREPRYCVLALVAAQALFQFQAPAQVAPHDKPPKEARRLCKKLVLIKKLPFRRDEAEIEAFKLLDPTYGEFRERGEAMVPCLIQRITDTVIMDDPSQAPHYGQVVVGDVAFWVFLHITGMHLEDALPDMAKVEFKERGRYAYLDWVRKTPANRSQLQRNVRSWFEQRSKAGGRGFGGAAKTPPLR